MVQLHRPTGVEAGGNLPDLAGQALHTAGLAPEGCRHNLLAPYHHSQPGVHEQHNHTASCMHPRAWEQALASGAAQTGWNRQQAGWMGDAGCRFR